MKKFLSVLTATLMALSLCTTALAAGDDLLIAPAPVSPAPNAGGAAMPDLPYEGVNIWLNGGYMTFEDAVPAIVDGRTQAPYRAVLEAMGAEVSYDDGDIEAKFEDGSVMDLAIGSKIMTYTKGEVVKTVEMDVAPYIDQASGRTFVPVRFIGEAVGQTVTWNGDVKVAYFVDWDALVAEIDQQFSEFNEMMAASSATTLDPDKTYKTSEEVYISGWLAGQESLDPLKLTLSGDTISDSKTASCTVKLDIDLGGYKTPIEEMGEEVMQVIETLDGAEMDVIVSAQGQIFMKSQLISMLAGDLVPENNWLMIDMAAILAEMGIDMEELLTGAAEADMTMGQVIRMLSEDGTIGAAMGYMAPDQVAEVYTGVYAGLFGNDCITKTTAGRTTTYSLKADAASIFDGMMTAEEIEKVTFDFEMGIVLKNEKVTDVTAKMNIAMEGLSMTMDISGTDVKAEGTIVIAVDEVGKMEMGISSDTVETNEKPLSAPSENIVSFEELMEIFMSAMGSAQVR